jgi:hypothetical protein
VFLPNQFPVYVSFFHGGKRANLRPACANQQSNIFTRKYPFCQIKPDAVPQICDLWRALFTHLKA